MTDRINQAIVIGIIVGMVLSTPVLVKSGVLSDQTQEACAEQNGNDLYYQMVGCPLGGITSALAIVFGISTELFILVFILLKIFDFAVEMKNKTYS